MDDTKLVSTVEQNFDVRYEILVCLKAWCRKEGKKGGWSMAVKEIKDIGASVLTRLKKQVKGTGINYQI